MSSTTVITVGVTSWRCRGNLPLIFNYRHPRKLDKTIMTKLATSEWLREHELARANYYVMRDQVPFDVNKAFA